MNTIGFPALVHELQGRVASIAIFSEQLMEDPARAEPFWFRDRLRRINLAATEMQRVIETVKRLEEDAEVDVVRIDLSALSAQALRRIVQRKPDYGRATVWIQTGMEMDGDAGEMEIVLENLLGNALKFSSVRRAPEVRVTASSQDGRTVIGVSDNGIGIAPEDVERIFEPFTRCHSGFEGSGVGLALVGHIVRRHGGRVWAHGELGVGATISFCV